MCNIYCKIEFKRVIQILTFYVFKQTLRYERTLFPLHNFLHSASDHSAQIRLGARSSHSAPKSWWTAVVVGSDSIQGIHIEIEQRDSTSSSSQQRLEIHHPIDANTHIQSQFWRSGSYWNRLGVPESMARLFCYFFDDEQEFLQGRLKQTSNKMWTSRIPNNEIYLWVTVNKYTIEEAINRQECDILCGIAWKLMVIQ